MESQPDPWWYNRCTHRFWPLWRWIVAEEAEQLAVLYVYPEDKVHVCVDIAGVGSICRSLTPEQWESMDRIDQLKYVQNECRELKSTVLDGVMH